MEVSADSVVDEGDFAPKEYFEIEERSERLLKKGLPIITLGGDHSITYPVVKAYTKRHPKIDILHFDAHTDLYHDFEGDPYSHACPFARIMELGCVGRIVQVGIRTLSPHQEAQAAKFGVEILHMRNQSEWVMPAFENPVYLSLDIDGVDPAFAPGVSHHEPGGLTPRFIFEWIHKLQGKLIGADVVEYNPNRDVQGITGALAAKFVKEIAGKLLS